MNYKTKLYRPSKYFLLFLTSLLVFNCKDGKKKLDSRVASLPYYQEASFTPFWFEKGTEAQKTFHQIPAFSFTNQEGKTITEETFKDKIYITDFFFTTCPGICPKMTANMDILQQEFKNDDEILLLSHSVTPEMDSVPVLKAYAENKGIDSKKWHLVTGDRSQIYDLGRNHYFVEEDLGETKTEDDFLHTENFVLIDKNRQIRGIYNGLNKTAVQQLIADIKTLQKE
ncbi:SCO family protein [uncultured Kordia sp.]|uniref:SCO family protein n=1 Tax=uncultured Kordia sp. TaxID=507699 RepID=UPI002604824D|nr:SCO family protein [uncultured Kordia sp.]